MNKQQQQLGLDQSSGPLGLDQPMAPNPQLQTTDDLMLRETRVPKENSFPSLTPQPYEPDIKTQVIDHNHHLNSGVYSPVKVESYEQAELRMKREEQRVQRTRKSIYQTPPQSGGAPNIQEPPKPTEEQLSKLRKLESLRSINNKVRSLKLDEQRTSLKLSNIRNSIKALITEAEALTTSKTEN